MAKVIAVVSQKGGVGKTTTAANLGAAFAREGQNVLLLEVDPQGALAPCFGIDPTTIQHGLASVLQDHIEPRAAVIETSMAGVSLLPALAPHEDELELERCASAHTMHLREVVDALVPHYDVVIVDAPPTLGFLARMTLAAADSYLVPVQAEQFAYRTLDRLIDTVETIKKDFNPELTCEGLLITMVDLRTRMSVKVVNQLYENFGDKVLMSMVPRTVTLQDMPVKGKPTVVHAAASRGGKAYNDVAQEIMANQQKPAVDPMKDLNSNGSSEDELIESMLNHVGLTHVGLGHAEQIEEDTRPASAVVDQLLNEDRRHATQWENLETRDDQFRRGTDPKE